MKIALCISYFTTRLEYLENALIREFGRLGHEVVVVTSDRHFPQEDYDATLGKVLGSRNLKAGEFIEDGVRVVRLKTRVFGRRGNIEVMPGLTRTLVTLSPDLILFHSVEHAFHAMLAVLARLWLRNRLFMIVNARIVEGSAAEPDTSLVGKVRAAIERQLRRVALMASHKVVAMNERSFDYALEIHPRCKTKLIDITLGVDHRTVFLKPECRETIRATLQYGEQDVVIVHSGKIVSYKRTDLLVHAVVSLKDRPIKLLVVGDGPDNYRRHLQAIASEGGIEERMTLLPAVVSSELYKYLSAGDIAVWPDSATISTIEASAVGIPVIVPDFHGYEHRTKNDNGLRIKPGDLDDLTSNLRLLVDNRELRTEMGRRGRELVEKELNWESIARRVLSDSAGHSRCAT